MAAEVGAEEVVFQDLIADATGRGHSYELIADTMELPASAPAPGGRRSATGEVRPTGGEEAAAG